MDRFKPTFGIEPTDKYAKARQDVIQALNSISELAPWQREQLAQDLLGTEATAALCNMMRQHFR